MIPTLISSSTFPLSSEKGLPRFAFDLAEALAQRCDVTALVPASPHAPQREVMGSVDVRRFTYFIPRHLQTLAYRNGMRANLKDSYLCWFQVLPYFFSQALSIRRLVREKGIQIVNSHWMVPQGLSSTMARNSKNPFVHVLSVHAADVYMLRNWKFGKAVARYVIDRTDHVFADGSDVRDNLDRLLGRPSEAILQPMGVHVELFQQGARLERDENPFPENGFLLFLGRFIEKKGVPYLLRAMLQVRDRHPGMGLVLIGYGAQEEELRNETERLGLNETVVFAGRRSHAEIGRYLRSCRLAVVPSIIDRNGETDGMPTVVVEAMASGTQVVGSAVDGIPDVIRHGENGWLCREKDEDDLAEKILMALANPTPSRIIQQAIETARRFDWSDVAQHYLEVFERLTNVQDPMTAQPAVLGSIVDSPGSV